MFLEHLQDVQTAIHLNTNVQIFYLKLPLMNMTCLNLTDLFLKQVQSIKSSVAAGVRVGTSCIS